MSSTLNMFNIDALIKWRNKAGINQSQAASLMGYKDHTGLSKVETKNSEMPGYKLGILLNAMAKKLSANDMGRAISEIFGFKDIFDFEKKAGSLTEPDPKYVSLLEKYVNILEEYEKIKREILRLKHVKRKDDPEDFDPSKQTRSMCKLIC